jgi:amino acid transporter
MARDGVLPRVLAGRDQGPPAAAVLLQGVLALALLFTHRLQQMLVNVGAILTLFAALVALSLFRVRFGRRDLPPPPRSTLVASAVFVAFAAWMLYFGFRGATHLVAWLAVIAAVALVFYATTARWRRPRAVRE